MNTVQIMTRCRGQNGYTTVINRVMRKVKVRSNVSVAQLWKAMQYF